MSIYDPISIALGIEPIEFIEPQDNSDIEPGNTKGDQAFNLEANRINASLGGKAKALKKYPAWNKNIKGLLRSAESIEKQKLTMTGKLRGPYANYNHAASSKSIILDNKTYPSISSAIKDTGMAYYTIMRRLRKQQLFLEQQLCVDD
jgi:hypothetical protein